MQSRFSTELHVQRCRMQAELAEKMAFNVSPGELRKHWCIVAEMWLQLAQEIASISDLSLEL